MNLKTETREIIEIEDLKWIVDVINIFPFIFDRNIQNSENNCDKESIFWPLLRGIETYTWLKI